MDPKFYYLHDGSWAYNTFLLMAVDDCAYPSGIMEDDAGFRCIINYET